jgi:HAD superfamily hydrolase (TIGR01490 family)
MTREKKYAVFFDLDKTILTLNSGSVLVRQAYKSGLMSTRDLFSAIWQSFLFKFDLRDTNLIISGMGRWVRGLTPKSVMDLSENIVSLFLIKAVRPEIYSEICYHKELEADLVILSSALYSICKPISDHLGVERIICTEMEVTNGVFTGSPAGQFCFGKEKQIRLLEYCKKNNYDLNETWCYADSISDLPVLEVVGNPVCVVPDRRLEMIAREKGWKIYDW